MNREATGRYPVCGAKLRIKNITYTQELEGKIYVVSDVPAEVCPQCGEQYLAPETVDALQEVIEQGEQGKTLPVRQVLVYHYP